MGRNTNSERLTPAQRETLVAPLRERWNRNPGERARMLERAQRWSRMPREKRERAGDGLRRWEHMTPPQRAQARALFHATRGMRPGERQAFMAEWRRKSPQQKAEWVRANPPSRR